ncbi:hypothetical protein V2S85_23105 [Novosphingobium resinovorum]|nr:hypothetical protein [Novosphingobium resinovorum]
MSLLRIGDLLLMRTDANVTPALGQKFTRAMPLTHAWIVAEAYGPIALTVLQNNSAELCVHAIERELRHRDDVKRAEVE